MMSRTREKEQGGFCYRGVMLILALLAGWSLLPGQINPSRVPIPGKNTTGPSNLRAFIGRVSSIKPENKLLMVQTSGGEVTEIFSCKKGTDISTAAGERKKFRDLELGMTVMVYYASKEGHRTVKSILILNPAPAKEAKSSLPNS